MDTEQSKAIADIISGQYLVIAKIIEYLHKSGAIEQADLKAFLSQTLKDCAQSEEVSQNTLSGLENLIEYMDDREHLADC